MKFFLLDQSEETQLKQKALCLRLEKENPAEKIQTELFTKTSKHCFEEMERQDLGATFWFGKMENKRFGDFNADEFVKKFILEFEYRFNREDKSRVEDVFFMFYGVQTFQPGVPSFPQLVEAKLAAHGFNVKVHAITSIPDETYVMHMDVLKQVGSPTKSTLQQQQGDAYAYVTKKKTDEASTKTPAKTSRFPRRKNKSAAGTQKRRIESATSATNILNTSLLKLHLLRPHNTFAQGQQVAVKNVAQEQALISLEQKIRIATQRKNFDEAARLKDLHELIAFEKEDWTIHVAQAMIDVARGMEKEKEKATAPKPKKQVSFQLPQEIEMKTFQKLPRKDKEKERDARGPDIIGQVELIKKSGKLETPLGRYLVELFTSARSVAETKKIHHKAELLSGKKRLVKPAVIAEVAVEEKKEMPAQMKIALDKIAELAGLLEQEYKYKRSWLGIFCPSTKTYKAGQLEQLAKSINYEFQSKGDNCNWVLLVEGAMLDKRLIQSCSSRRTLNLLENIVDGKAERGTNDTVERAARCCLFR